ncbi:MAG: hypothetical protein ACRCY4_10660 [Brevinema sp.]
MKLFILLLLLIIGTKTLIFTKESSFNTVGRSETHILLDELVKKQKSDPKIITNLFIQSKTLSSQKFPSDKELLAQRTPVSSMNIHNRLVKTEDNILLQLQSEDFKMHHMTETSHILDYYLEIFIDPITKDYYQGIFFRPSLKDIARLNTLKLPSPEAPFLHPTIYYTSNSRPATFSVKFSPDRFFLLTNLEPHIRIYADRFDNNRLWGQWLTKIPDFYKGVLFFQTLFYDDSNNNINIKLTPITNSRGFVAYEGEHPITKQKFYANRGMYYSGEFSRELRRSHPVGSIEATDLYDTPEGAWNEQYRIFLLGTILQTED